MASPTPQASLECGSSLPLSALRVFPIQSSLRPPIGGRVEGDLPRISWRRILSEASPEKAVASYRSSKAAAPRCRGSSIPTGCAARWHLRRRRRPWSAEARFRFRLSVSSRFSQACGRRWGEESRVTFHRISWRRILSEASPEKAVASYRAPKRLRRGAGAAQSRPAAPHDGISDAAGVPGVRKLASAFGSPCLPGSAKPAAAGWGEESRVTFCEFRGDGYFPRPLRRKR